VSVEPAGLLEDAVDAGRATGSEVGVVPHEGLAAVAFHGEECLEVADGLTILGFESVARGIQALCSLTLP
jgi:hypothetical protein